MIPERSSILAKTDRVITVIENTAGQGSNLGFRFEQITLLYGLREKGP